MQVICLFTVTKCKTVFKTFKSIEKIQTIIFSPIFLKYMITTVCENQN